MAALFIHQEPKIIKPSINADAGWMFEVSCCLDLGMSDAQITAVMDLGAILTTSRPEKPKVLLGRAVYLSFCFQSS